MDETNLPLEINPLQKPAELQIRAKAGLVAGAVAALMALLVWQQMARVPFGFLFLDAAMAWGVHSTILVRHRQANNARPALVAILAPFLVAGMLARQTLDPTQWGYGLTNTIILPALLVSAAALADRRVLTKFIALVGAGLVVTLAAVAVIRAPAYGALLFTIALVSVTGLLFLQAFSRKSSGRFAVWATPAALTISASQLLDGVVTYLAVRDPLDVTPRTFYEQMPASDWILENLGPGYIVVKWALALGIVLGIESKDAWNESAPKRVGIYLVIAMLGFGPGLFSAGNLLS